MTGRVPAHEHVWHPISHDEAGKPVLFACGAYWQCIKTQTLIRKGRKPNYTWNEPQPQAPRPTTGLWKEHDATQGSSRS